MISKQFKSTGFKKRLILIFIVTFLVTSLQTLPFVQAAGGLQVSIGSVSGEPGSTVSVPVTLKNVPSSGIYSCNFRVDFSPKELSVIGITPGSLIINPNELTTNFNKTEGAVSVVFLASGNESTVIKNDGTLFSIRFKIPDNAPAGAVYNITSNASKSYAFSSSYTKIQIANYINGLVKVTGDTSSTTAPAAIPSPKPTVTPIYLPKPTITPTMTPVTSTPKPSPAKKGNTPSPAAFSDIGGHWAEEFTKRLSDKGVINGYPDGTIKPDAEINRAEVIVLIVKAAGLNTSSGTNLTFKDRDKIPKWAEDYIMTAVDRGITSGYEDNSFRPFNKVTRKEMAVMLMKAFGHERLDNVELSFKDSWQIPSWSKGYVAKAKSLGVISGYGDNTFRPDKSITRAEVFTMISKCMEIDN